MILCERIAVLGNPVDGVKRPMANNHEGSTPALGDAQARRLLEAPAPDTLKGVRHRAIIATLLYHGIRREELCNLRVRDMHTNSATCSTRGCRYCSIWSRSYWSFQECQTTRTQPSRKLPSY